MAVTPGSIGGDAVQAAEEHIKEKELRIELVDGE
jgi:hypothetical protein